MAAGFTYQPARFSRTRRPVQLLVKTTCLKSRLVLTNLNHFSSDLRAFRSAFDVSWNLFSAVFL